MENDDFNKGCLVDRETRTKEKNARIIPLMYTIYLSCQKKTVCMTVS